MDLKYLLIGVLLLTSLTSKLEALQSRNDSKIPSPIILVPGDGGARAYSYIRYLVTVKCLVWVNFEYMVLPTLLKNVFKLNYDPTTHKTSNVPGSNVFFPGWGNTETIEELDERKHEQTTYFANLVNSLTEDKFYVRNKTVRGAPYDFRKAPNENENFVPDLQKLIEETYTLSNNQPVVILGHSLGSLYSLFFLKNMTVSWKQKYVRAFLAVSAPLAGAVKAVILETSGVSLGSPRRSIYFREMQRSFPSSTFLLPRPDIYGKDPIVITPTKNYSSYDYKALFQDMNVTYGSMMYDDTKHLVNGDETPEGVDEIYCIYGTGTNTPNQLIFKSFPDTEPKFNYGDGDSTVNIQSLEICKKWKNVKTYTIDKADHMGIVRMPEFLTLLKQILYRQPNKKFPIKSYKNENEKFIHMF